MAKIFDNIGVTQGRMVPSEKKEEYNTFQLKIGKKK